MTSVADEIYAALAAQQPEPSFFTNFGNAVGGMELPVAKSNAAALLGPLAVGLTSGLAQGYGKQQDKQRLFDYYQTNPLIKALSGGLPSPVGPVASGEEYASLLAGKAPSDWTPQVAQSDFLLSLLDRENKAREQAKAEEAQALADKQDFEIKKAIASKFGKLYEPALGVALDIPGIDAGGGKSDFKLGAEEQKDLGKSYGVIQEATTVADMLDQSKNGWLDYRLLRNFGAADKDGLGVAIANLADRLTRARTGAALNKNEQKLYEAMVGGDLTVDPKQAANLLRKLADSEQRNLTSRIDFAETLGEGGPEAIRTRLADLAASRGKSALAAQKPDPAAFSSFEEYKAAKDAWRAAGGS